MDGVMYYILVIVVSLCKCTAGDPLESTVRRVRSGTPDLPGYPGEPALHILSSSPVRHSKKSERNSHKNFNYIIEDSVPQSSNLVEESILHPSYAHAPIPVYSYTSFHRHLPSAVSHQHINFESTRKPHYYRRKHYDSRLRETLHRENSLSREAKVFRGGIESSGYPVTMTLPHYEHNSETSPQMSHARPDTRGTTHRHKRRGRYEKNQKRPRSRKLPKEPSVILRIHRYRVVKKN